MAKKYRITGRFISSIDRHVVESGITSLSEAKARVAEIKREQARDKAKGGRTDMAGMIGVFTPWYPDYELVDIEIQEHEVTPWVTVSKL